MLTNQINSSQNPALPHISEVMPFNEKDNDLFKELRSVLEKHNAQSRFGINLLHDHFPLEQDEFMLETENSKGRVLNSRPEKLSVVNRNIDSTVITQWRLDSPLNLATPTLGCVKMQGGRHDVQV
jgi:hypothetical protein